MKKVIAIILAMFVLITSMPVSASVLDWLNEKMEEVGEKESRIDEIKQQIFELQNELIELEGYIDIEPGYYEIGTDIPEGRYDIEALRSSDTFYIYESYDTFISNGQYSSSYSYDIASKSTHEKGLFDYLPEKVTNVTLSNGNYIYTGDMLMRLYKK